VTLMKARTGLWLSAAALGWLGLSPGAFATGQPQPNTNIIYSAQTVALPAGGNTVAISSLSYNTVNFATTLTAGSNVSWAAPSGNNWANIGATCASFPGGVAGVLSGFGTNTLVCTLGAGGPYSQVIVSNPAVNTAAVNLSGPTVALLGQNIQVNQPTLGATPTNPSALVPITAQGGGTAPDTAPIPNVTLTSNNTFALITIPVPLGIDLTGAGLPAIPPGAGFTTRAATGASSVSTAGYLGSFWINFNQGTLDARNGVFAVGPNDPSTPPLSGTVTVTLTADFATLTDAYLIPNTSTAGPTGNQSACTATRPGNATGGTTGTTINATRNVITFSGLTSPTNGAGNANEPVFSVCLVTNGNQVIQATANTGPPAIAINASITVAGITNPIGLTVANQGFGSIDYLGSVFFAQNVFGINNGSPTFFRMVNQSNTAAQVWAVLTKDVVNQTPEVGNGSCNYPAASTTTTATASIATGGVANNPPATCNVSFVADLRSLPTGGDVLTNLSGGGPTGTTNAGGTVLPNNATYVTGDDIAILAGTSLTPVAGQGSLHATVYLLSPNTGMRFSALTQSAMFGVLVQSP
jgi:hypothetical protein